MTPLSLHLSLLADAFDAKLDPPRLGGIELQSYCETDPYCLSKKIPLAQVCAFLH